MNLLTDSEIEVLAKIIENFEHPGSPSLPEEFKRKVMAVTSITEDQAEFLFDHVLYIDPSTRKAMHFHHKEFVIDVLARYQNKA